MESAGEWLEKALNEICKKSESGLDYDIDMISGLVSYCQLAPPSDAKEYLDNIIGEEVGKEIIEEYMKRRGFSNTPISKNTPASNFHTYVKPQTDETLIIGPKKPAKAQKQPPTSTSTSVTHTNQPNNPKKKKAGKIISLAEAAKGSVIFQQGKPCTCQARRHRLVSNCLCCGKIVCEQEGEGPCSFCGALVLKEGSTYAGLDLSGVVSSENEVAASAFVKKLVDFDRNSAARTSVIDDQSDYYDEGNSWLSAEEKELLKKKQDEVEAAEEAKRKRVVVAFDLVGRRVLLNQDDVSELESSSSILRPPDEKESNRIKPNPTLQVRPVFIDPGPIERPKPKPNKGRASNKGLTKGLCLEISGRVQHDRSDFNLLSEDEQPWNAVSCMEDDGGCRSY